MRTPLVYRMDSTSIQTASTLVSHSGQKHTNKITTNVRAIRVDSKLYCFTGSNNNRAVPYEPSCFTVAAR